MRKGEKETVAPRYKYTRPLHVGDDKTFFFFLEGCRASLSFSLSLGLAANIGC